MSLSEGIWNVVETRNNDTQNTHRFLVSIIQLGLKCSVTHPKERKDISQVVAELSSIQRILLGNGARGALKNQNGLDFV